MTIKILTFSYGFIGYFKKPERFLETANIYLVNIFIPITKSILSG